MEVFGIYLQTRDKHLESNSIEALRPFLPAIYRLAKRLKQLRVAKLHQDLELFLVALYVRLKQVHELYQENDRHSRTPSTDAVKAAISPPEWRSSGSQYAWKAMRSRPYYPRLPDDSAGKDVAEDDATCRKYYEAYTKKAQTGGLMASWCPHMMCLGWYVIPRAEGRNDIFSALFTRWPKPPKWVIYDFHARQAPTHSFGNTIRVLQEYHVPDGQASCA